MSIMPIEDALDRFMRQLRADGRSRHTIDQYRRHVRLLARWIASQSADMDVGDIPTTKPSPSSWRPPRR